MGIGQEAAVAVAGRDKYRSFLSEDEVGKVQWRNGAPPTFDVVNKLFEEGRTKVTVITLPTSLCLIYIYL